MKLDVQFVASHLHQTMYFQGYIHIVLKRMQNYEGISEMLDHGDFSEEIQLAENNILDAISIEQNKTPAALKADNLDVMPDGSSQLPISSILYEPLELNLKLPQIADRMVLSQNTQAISAQNNEHQSLTSHLGQTEVKKRIKKGSEYTKNILSNITQKSIQIMYSERKLLRKKCQKVGISYKEFTCYLKSAQASIKGPTSLAKMLQTNLGCSAQKKKIQLFSRMLIKIARKKYMIYCIKQGKMQDHKAYIRQKNTHLLNFADQLHQNT